MRAYELGVIIDGDLEEPVAQRWIKVINDQFKAAGGQAIGHPEWWGKRRFAYAIKKKEEGYYVFFNVVAPGGSLDELERSLRLSDEIVRHKLLRLPDHEAAKRGMVEQAG
jgi:small subunit ribosomal protein S6